jgi:hypothetical protein
MPGSQVQSLEVSLEGAEEEEEEEEEGNDDFLVCEEGVPLNHCDTHHRIVT